MLRVTEMTPDPVFSKVTLRDLDQVKLILHLYKRTPDGLSPTSSPRRLGLQEPDVMKVEVKLQR